MSERVVPNVEAGRPVAVKRARDEADVARLRREAELLRAIGHPGVVELVRLDEAADPVELVTVYVGPHSLLTVGALAPETIAGIGIAVARILADLHASGYVHGRIEPAHVLLATHGGPVLCGLARGGRAGHAVGDQLLDPRADVCALGELLLQLLGDDLEGDPVPERRSAAALGVLRRHAGPEAWRRRALLSVADHAAADDPSLRPSAAELADALAAAAPAARLPTGIGRARSNAAASLAPGVGAPRRAGRGRLVPLALTAAGLAGGLLLLSASRDPGASSPSASGATPDTVPAATPRRPGGGGAGSIEPSATVDGRTILRGDRRWSAGMDGDLVAVGDWDCDGSETPAVLRPSSGELFLFDSWSTLAGPVIATPSTVVPGATAIRSDGCGAVFVDRGALPTVLVVQP